MCRLLLFLWLPILVLGCNEDPISIQGQTITAPRGGDAMPDEEMEVEAPEQAEGGGADPDTPPADGIDEGQPRPGGENQTGPSPNPTPQPLVGGADSVVDSPTPMAPPRDPENPMPDRARFVTTVLPIIVPRCGVDGCHTSNRVRTGNRAFEIFGVAVEDLSEENIDLLMNELMDERFVDYNDLEGSILFTQHQGEGPTFAEFIPETQTYNVVIDWLRDAFFGPPPMMAPPVDEVMDEMMMEVMDPTGMDPPSSGGVETPMMGPDPSPDDPPDMGGQEVMEPTPPPGRTDEEIAAERCLEVPINDGIGPVGWRTHFDEMGINALFVGTPEEPDGGCGGSGCHSERGAGGTLFFRDLQDPCSADWNFFVTQSFVMPFDPLTSPILVKPLGEDSPAGRHGGGVVFLGRNDADYIRLKNWLEILVAD